ARLRKSEHRRRRGEHRDHDGVAASEAVGEVAAEAGGDEMARAVDADRQSRLRRGVAVAREIDRQHGHDEAAEAIDECACEKRPGGGGELAELVAKVHRLSPRARARGLAGWEAR